MKTFRGFLRPSDGTLIPILLPFIVGLVGCAPSISIERHFASPLEQGLIRVAEDTCPDRDEVVALARSLGSAEPQGDRLWWYCVVCNIQMPYAITQDAIDYYEDIAAHGVFSLNAGTMSYEANIAHKDNYTDGNESFSDVYVVEMQLAFSNMFFLSGVGFRKTRSVVLKADGAVLRITGDGPARYAIAK